MRMGSRVVAGCQVKGVERAPQSNFDTGPKLLRIAGGRGPTAGLKFPSRNPRWLAMHYRIHPYIESS